jgi:hypothetical protein
MKLIFLLLLSSLVLAQNKCPNCNGQFTATYTSILNTTVLMPNSSGFEATYPITTPFLFSFPSAPPGPKGAGAFLICNMIDAQHCKLSFVFLPPQNCPLAWNGSRFVCYVSSAATEAAISAGVRPWGDYTYGPWEKWCMPRSDGNWQCPDVKQ